MIFQNVTLRSTLVTDVVSGEGRARHPKKKTTKNKKKKNLKKNHRKPKKKDKKKQKQKKNAVKRSVQPGETRHAKK